MKIYAKNLEYNSRSKYENELDKFVGKDLWILIEDLADAIDTYDFSTNMWGKEPRKIYIKILRKLSTSDIDIYIIHYTIVFMFLKE